MKYYLAALLLPLVACEQSNTASTTTTEPLSTESSSTEIAATPPTADSVITANNNTTNKDTEADSTTIEKTANGLSAGDRQIIESFAQSGEGRNCASISVIKLAIRKYGTTQVFSKVDSSTTGFTVVLQDGKTIVLTRKELHDVGRFDNFRLAGNAATYKAARFMYAVMAKNKFLSENAQTPGAWPSLISIVNQDGRYHLLDEDTDNNFEFLGLKNNFVGHLPTEDAYNKSSVIVASCYHSAFGGMGYYDEYGDAELDDNFVRNHKGMHRKCNPIQWIYQLVK